MYLIKHLIVKWPFQILNGICRQLQCIQNSCKKIMTVQILKSLLTLNNLYSKYLDNI